MQPVVVLVVVLSVIGCLGRASDPGEAGIKSRTVGTSHPTEDQLPTPKPFKGNRRGQIHVGPDGIVIGGAEPTARKVVSGATGIHATKVEARLNPKVVSVICGNRTCDHHEVCVFKRETSTHVCARGKNFRSSRRHGHARAESHQGRGVHMFHGSAKIGRQMNDSELELHRRVRKLKVHAKEFQDQHDQRFKVSSTTGKITKLRSKKFIDDSSNVENNTSDKWNKECRQREMDGVGKRLLDQFKMNQDGDLDRQKTTNKRRKEKRNSTKKELHEDDECICQSPVSWQFQQLDNDTDGHLSQRELGDVTAQGVCSSQFVVSCDHDRDGNLSEKEWCCCFADILPPCLASLKNVPSVLLGGAPMLLPGAFMPQCDDDGFYSRVQCYGSTGRCWCVDRNGKRIGDYVADGSPECNTNGQQKSDEQQTTSSVQI